MDSQVYAVTVCVLIHRGNSFLLVVRAPGVGYAPNMIGMIGGHVDVTEVPLTYLESEFFITNRGERQITVTFSAPAPAGDEPCVNAPDELTEVCWWTLNDLEADARCPLWLPALIRRAALPS